MAVTWKKLAFDAECIKHSLATAANDFLVASGSGVFIKKTRAETMTILGLPLPFTDGDLLYGSELGGYNAVLALTAVATGNVLLSGGVFTAPAWGKVALTTHVSGILPAANGGTGGDNAWGTAQDPGHKHSKLWASDGNPEAITVDAAGNVGIGGSATSAARVETIASDSFNVINRVSTETLDNLIGVIFLTGSGNLSSLNYIAGIQAIITQADPSALKGELVFNINTGDSAQEAARIHDDKSAYFQDNVSALSFTDRTPHYEGDALKEIKKIKGKDGQISHKTLPPFAKRRIKVAENSPQEIGRDLGAMISILTVAVQQLTEKVEKLEKSVNSV